MAYLYTSIVNVYATLWKVKYFHLLFLLTKAVTAGQNDLKLIGKWSLPGGETKLFKNTEIILKWTGQTRKKLIIEKDSEVNLVANTLKRLCNGDVFCLDTATACKESIDDKATKQSVAADSEFSTIWAAINGIQDVVTAKLEEVTLAHDIKLIRIEAEVCKVRSNYERKIENLNNKCHELLLKLECKKALEDKVNKLEVLVGNLKADIQDLRNENGLFKLKPRLFKNSTPKVQQKNTGNNDLDLIGTINIPDEPITIVDKQPQDLNKNLELNTSLSVSNKTSRADKGSVYNPQMNSVIECIEARNQPRSNPPRGSHTSNVSKRNSAIPSHPLPKHLVPCPFLRRRGFCLKVPWVTSSIKILNRLIIQPIIRRITRSIVRPIIDQQCPITYNDTLITWAIHLITTYY
ncbi:Hypothetical predicted protein [Paramuricea clavata]|uniref:Uncharacterized protein n=1 Tax=Paramuricea clavata TaxID=317549 RepID=A0A6S7GVK8_PARCT|nr:Hypothetical predicted protein [Paramuricea clavata]